MLQDAALGVLAARVVTPENARAYFERAARNRAVDHVRTAAVSGEAPIAMAEHLPAAAADPEQAAGSAAAAPPRRPLA
jgi:DNA-directed RNA polymerase specialized sigma24 family protein